MGEIGDVNKRFRPALDRLIHRALEEDAGTGDVTTRACLSGRERGLAEVTAKEEMVVAGLSVFHRVFTLVDSDLEHRARVTEGERAAPGQVVSAIRGNASSILLAERTALNVFQRMCGIATETRRYVERVRGTGARVLDTRKTVPGFRELDKYAVRVGGCTNHRFGLSGGVLIKDNHIRAAGGITKAVRRCAEQLSHVFRIEVETRTLEEVREALDAGASIIMLDNMPPAMMREAVALVNGRALLEASGGIGLDNVRDVAETGVDFISVGALTHSVKAADISLNLVLDGVS